MPRKKKTLPIILLVCCIVTAGCARRTAPTQYIPVEKEVEAAIQSSGDLVAADDHQVYSVNTQTEQALPIFQTEEPVSGLQQNDSHLVVTVSDPDNSDAFQGFYHKPKAKAHFEKVPTPGISPVFSYLYKDELFLASGLPTVRADGPWFKVGIFNLASKKWLKQWDVPGQPTDLKGKGPTVYLVGTDYKAVTSGIYAIDMTTAKSTTILKDPHPLDRVMVDANGDLYMAISSRNRNEWNNKIYRYDPKAYAYSLFDRFWTNTRPMLFDLLLIDGKALISRYDTMNQKTIRKPLSVLDVKTKKQTHIPWDYQPLSIDAMADGTYAVLGNGGEFAIVDPAEVKIVKQFAIPDLSEGKWMTVKKKG